MKGDFSKDTFHPEKHFHDVLMQQGRVLLDAEWNEQAAINAYRTETGVKDIVGDAGAPLHNAGFNITAGVNNMVISAGRFYVDGILCENEKDVNYTDQPDYTPVWDLRRDSTYVVYLDVWQRHITSLEDRSIFEVALGTDTTTRKKTIWQVKLIRQGDATRSLTDRCALGLPASVTTPVTGMLTAKTATGDPGDKPCGLEESGGYTRLENQLYRVEIYQGGDETTSTFTWSRDNGSVLVRWESQAANDLVANTPGKDDLLNFKTGNWIELTNDKIDKAGKRGILVKLDKANEKLLTINPGTAIVPADLTELGITGINKSEFGETARIRRWDNLDTEGAIHVNKQALIPLEDGVEVGFSTGTFKSCDYWLIPARTNIADIEWLKDAGGLFMARLPFGIEHHYCKLGLLAVDPGNNLQTTDCRPIFPPITELTSLFYVSGDGQEAMPATALPCQLKVGVANGQWPVDNANIEFRIVSGGGKLDDGTAAGRQVYRARTGQAVNPLDAKPGVAESLNWVLGPSGVQQVVATLQDDAGNVKHLPVFFNANLSLASTIKFDGTGCDEANWQGEPHNTVAEAITALCKRKSTSTSGCSVTVGKDGQFRTIPDAFDAFRDKGSICICLLAGDHKLGNFDFGNIKFENIEISGCGATIVMVAERLILMAQAIMLHEVRIIPALDNRSNCQIDLSGNVIVVDQCEFQCKDNDFYRERPFVSIGPFKESDKSQAEIHWSDNKVTVGKTGVGMGLALLQRSSGWVNDSNIFGDLVLQYHTKVKDANWSAFLQGGQLPNKPTIERLLFDILKLRESGKSLHVSRNTVGRIRTDAATIMNEFDKISVGKPMTETQPAFPDLFISDNILSAGLISSFVGNMVTISNNHFLNNKSKTIVAYAIGFRAILTGNMDLINSDNNGSIIETIFNRKIISPNLIVIQ